MAFIWCNGKWAIDRTKPFLETSAYRTLRKRAEKIGLTVDADDELIFLTSKIGIVFNDRLCYDVINHTDNRVDVIQSFTDTIKHYKNCLEYEFNKGIK